MPSKKSCTALSRTRSILCARRTSTTAHATAKHSISRHGRNKRGSFIYTAFHASCDWPARWISMGVIRIPADPRMRDSPLEERRRRRARRGSVVQASELCSASFALSSKGFIPERTYSASSLRLRVRDHASLAPVLDIGSMRSSEARTASVRARPVGRQASAASESGPRVQEICGARSID